MGYEYGLTDLDEYRYRRRSNDAWSIGSTASSRSIHSPEVEGQSIWEGETLTSSNSDDELSEVVVR